MHSVIVIDFQYSSLHCDCVYLTSCGLS